MSQRTPAQLRAEAEAELIALGSKRVKLRTELDKVEEKLRPVVVHAVVMEVPYRRITELTGIASNTARAWREADRPAS